MNERILEKPKCLCGKEGIALGFLPIAGICSNMIPVLEKQFLCEYHAEKAKEMGYKVIE